VKEIVSTVGDFITWIEAQNVHILKLKLSCG